MSSEQCTHADQWTNVYYSAVQSGYDRGYAEGFAAAELNDDQFAELVSRKITDRADQRTTNAEFARMVINQINAEAERRKRGIR